MTSSTGTSRVIALVDMDCFYVQVEERDDPSIKGKPAAVVQYKAYKGGGIIAVNYEARAKGVSRHIRGDDAKAICPEIILVRVPETREKADLTKYRDASTQVMQVLSEFSPCIERASIDEAYIDLTAIVQEIISSFTEENMFAEEVDIIKGLPKESLQTNFVLGHESSDSWLEMITSSEMLPTDDLRLAIGAEIVGRMREAVYQKTGFRCSAGIAHNKVLAKLCAGLNKPNKQTVLPHASVPHLWSTTPVKKVRNLGGKFGDVLVEKFGVELMSDLLKFSEKDLAKHCGTKAAFWVYNLVRGFDDEIVNSRQLPKSIGCNKNFNGKEALITKEKVKHWLGLLTEEVVERITKDHAANQRRARTLSLHVTFEDQNSTSKACRCHPQYNSERIIAEVWAAMERLYQKIGVLPVTMLGLGATNFEDETDPGCEKISKYFDAQSTATSTTASDNAASSSTPAAASSTITSETTDPPPVRKPYFVVGVAKPWGEEINNPPKKAFDPKTNWMCNIPGLEPSEIPLTQKCDRCGAFINIYKFVEHHDHHTARDVSREINGLPPLGFDLRPETLQAREREEFLQEREKVRLEKANKRPRGRGGGRGASSSKRGKSSASPKKPIKPIDSYFVKMNPT